jgi:hypothetical protein
MFWHKNKKSKKGGYWRCTIKKKENCKKYSHSSKGRNKKRELQNLRRKTPEGRAAKRRSDKKYEASEKGKIVKRRYNQKPNVFMRKYFYNRDRQLKMARAKTIEQLEDIRNQLKELGLEPR